jgi:hypothetical protein
MMFRAAEPDAMQCAEPGQDLLTDAGQAARALVAPRPDPVRISPAMRAPTHCIEHNLSCYDTRSTTIWTHARRSGHPTEVHCAE